MLSKHEPCMSPDDDDKEMVEKVDEVGRASARFGCVS